MVHVPYHGTEQRRTWAATPYATSSTAGRLLPDRSSQGQ